MAMAGSRRLAKGQRTVSIARFDCLVVVRTSKGQDAALGDSWHFVALIRCMASSSGKNAVSSHYGALRQMVAMCQSANCSSAFKCLSRPKKGEAVE